MHIAHRHSIPAKVHYKLAVAVHTHHIALLPLEGPGKHTQPDVVARKFDKGVAQEGDARRVVTHNVHKRLHHTVGYGGGTAGAAVFDKKILGKVLAQKFAQLFGGSLQKYQSADSLHLKFFHAPPIGGLLVAHGAVYKAFGAEVALYVATVQPLFKSLNRHVLYVNVAPWQGPLVTVVSLLASGYISHSRDRFFVSPDYVDALWQTLVTEGVCTGCR